MGAFAWNPNDFSGGGGSGNVNGPASATDNAIARWDGSTGKLLQNSGATISDAGIFTLSGAIYNINGGAGVPAYTFASDTNTGMYRPSTDTLGFTCGGDDKVWILSSNTVQFRLASAETQSILNSVSDGSISFGADTGGTAGGNIQLYGSTHASLANTIQIRSGSTTRIQTNGTGIGFFASSPVAKPTVTGSRGGNAALQSLLTALSNLGLVTDSTT